VLGEGGSTSWLSAVIEDGTDGHEVNQIDETSDVIDMKVGEQEIVDPGDACVFRCGDDSTGVTAIAAGEAGVDENEVLSGRMKRVACPPSVSTK